MGIFTTDKNPNLIQVKKDVRVEKGPVIRHEKATKQLLSDEYSASWYKEGSKDALGKIIHEGEEIDFLDWLGNWYWKVYQLKTAMLDKDGRITDDSRYRKADSVRYVCVGQFASKAEAIKYAKSL